MHTHLLQRRVRIDGISGRKELNGQCGLAIMFSEAKGRYAVRLDRSGEEILVKPSNLAEAAEPAGCPPPVHEGYGEANGTDCPVCLQLLARPVTLGCGHNFCRPCLSAALVEGSERCPICRAAVPPSRLLEPNRLLASLLRERDPDAYDARLAELPPDVPAEPPLAVAMQNWKLYVDYLSPASLILLAVDRALDAPLSASICEQHVKFTDDNRVPEWELSEETDCVPRLEAASDGARQTITLVEPLAVLCTQLDVWGQGRLRPSRLLPAAELAQHEQTVQAAWTHLVRPVSIHLMQCNWGICCPIPMVQDLVAALQWVDQHVCARAVGHEYPSAASRTALDLIVGVPCAMLAMLKSRIVQDAAGAMPRFKTWVQGCIRQLQPELSEWMRRSEHRERYADKLFSAEAMGIMSSARNAHLHDLYRTHGGGGRLEHARPQAPPWPYQEKSSARRERAKTLSEELGKREKYRNRINVDDEEESGSDYNSD